MLEKYKAFLFDMDGTLVDSEPLKGEALALSCAHFGSEVSADVYKDIMGESIETVARHFFKVADISPDLNEFLDIFKTTYRDLLRGKAKLIPGVGGFIDHLSRKKVKIGLVSSAYRWMVMNVLEQIGFNNTFDIIITQEDVQKHKPDPQAYLLAVERLAVKARETLAFEDSSAGLTAADRAGCDTIAVMHDFNPGHNFGNSLLRIDNYQKLIKEIS